MLRCLTSGRQRVALCWNWKTALFSACFRAALFAVVALKASRTAALQAAVLEIALTTALAGFQGGISQALRGFKPRWRATLLCSGAVAIVYHPAEFLLHSWLRTPNAPLAIAVSLLYTVVSTHCSLSLMRHGLFVAGGEGHPLSGDLRRLAVLLARFAGAPFSTQQARSLEHF
jgi:hypothetical protein